MVSATCNTPCSFSMVVWLVVGQQLIGIYFILRSIYIKNPICCSLLLWFLSWKQMNVKLGLPCNSLPSAAIHSLLFSCPIYVTAAHPLPLLLQIWHLKVECEALMALWGIWGQAFCVGTNQCQSLHGWDKDQRWAQAYWSQSGAS